MYMCVCVYVCTYMYLKKYSIRKERERERESERHIRTMVGGSRPPGECWADWNQHSLRRARVLLHQSGEPRWSTFLLGQIWGLYGHMARSTEGGQICSSGRTWHGGGSSRQSRDHGGVPDTDSDSTPTWTQNSNWWRRWPTAKDGVKKPTPPRAKPCTRGT